MPHVVELQDTALAARLATMVVKEGLTLGNLPAADRDLALAWVWAGLPEAEVLSEPGINAQLKARLAGAAAFLDTDHVELRRWLVDGAWLARDGFGREYRRVPCAQLQERHVALAAALQGFDTDAWAASARDEKRALRRARQQAWQSAQPRPA
jgi:hypothetical protein